MGKLSGKFSGLLRASSPVVPKITTDSDNYGMDSSSVVA